MPESHESEVLALMKKHTPENGLYIFPGAEMTRARTKDEEAAWTAKLKAGPSGLLIIRLEGAEPMMPLQLGTEFGTNVVSALLAGLLLSATRLRFAGRVGFVTLLGLFGFVIVDVPHWNWYGFPNDFTVAAGIEHVVGWFLGGLVLAAIVRHPHARERIEPVAT